MKNGSRERRYRLKLIGAAALVILFAAVVLSVPDNRLAWQGPLVMGTLAMPTPNPAKFPPRDVRPNSDSMFSLLGFISVVGVLGLAGKWFLTKPSPKKVKIADKVVHPLVFP